MNQIRIIPDSTCQGEGISKGLARGLLVYYADQNLTGEGMGRFQGSIMLPVPALSTLLGIHPLFETIPYRGKVTYSYRVTGTNVEVQVEIITPVMPQDTLCLSNELSAAWFTAGWDGERPVSPPLPSINLRKSSTVSPFRTARDLTTTSTSQRWKKIPV
jgi:hypothetical protein